MDAGSACSKPSLGSHVAISSLMYTGAQDASRGRRFVLVHTERKMDILEPSDHAY